jgi:hypothetical protein
LQVNGGVNWVDKIVEVGDFYREFRFLFFKKSAKILKRF